MLLSKEAASAGVQLKNKLACLKTRLVKKHSLNQNKDVITHKFVRPIFILSFLLSVQFFIEGCSKGFILKFGDQDIFAFGSVDACNFVQNSQGVRISWKSSVPAHFIITSTVPRKYDQSIINAADTWNTRKRMNLIEVHRDDNYPASAANDGTNGIYFLSTWDSSESREQGRTAIKWDTSKIRDADIKINAQNFDFFIEGDTDRAGKVSIQSLILHEMGHALGLKHISDEASSMQPSLASSTSRTAPSEVDINSLNCEY